MAISFVHRFAAVLAAVPFLVTKNGSLRLLSFNVLGVSHPTEGGIFEAILRPGPGDWAIERAIERPSERSSDRASDRAIERSSDRAIERAIERASQRANERASDRAIDRAIERSTDNKNS